VISPDVSIRQAAAMIADEQVGMLLVVDARGVLVGLLSERDIVRFIAARGNDALASGVSARGYQPSQPSMITLSSETRTPSYLST